MLAGALNNPAQGTTAKRPTQGLVSGQTYFDTTINKPVWWKASTSHWVDATGTNA